MEISEKLEKHWRDAMQQPESRRPDALARAVAGVMPVDADADVLRNPLWLSEEEYARRQSVMEQIKLYNSSGWCVTAHDYIDLHDGNPPIKGDDFQVRMHRLAYDMLRNGADIRAVAVASYMTVEAVQDLAQQFNLHQPISSAF